MRINKPQESKCNLGNNCTMYIHFQLKAYVTTELLNRI